ncbi:MAG: serine hydrolase domain-containing protein [Pseudomonadota bacterium]
MRLTVLAMACAVTSAGVLAQDAPEKTFEAPKTLAELSERIAKTVEESDVAVGLVASLVDADGVLWAEGFGYADKASQTPATADTPFRAGSISKSITGLISARLAEDGILDLDTPLREVAPEIEFTNRWEDEDPVRLVHLLEHTTGWDDIHISEYRDFGPNPSTEEGLRFNPRSRTSRWRPGRYASYANSGPASMGFVLEKLTGRTFEDLAQSLVLDPIGAGTATFDQSADTAELTATSYRPDGSPSPYTRIWASASGSLSLSVRDLGQLARLYIRRGEMNGERVISTAAIERIETPTTSLAGEQGLAHGYGLGNYASFYDDVEYRGHDGGIDGFISTYAYRKDAGVGFAMMINSPDGETFRAVRKLLTSYLNTQYPSTAAAPTPTDATNLERFAGYYRPFTPRNEFTRLISDIAGVVRIRAQGESLTMTPLLGGETERFVPTGEHSFAGEGRAAPELLFYEGPSGSLEAFAGFNNTLRPISALAAYAPVALLAAVVLASLAALLFAAIWALGYPFGAFRESNRWRVWLWPFLSVLTLGAAVAGLIVGASGDPIAALGEPSIYSLALQYGGWATMVCAVLGMVAAMTNRNSSDWARLHAGFTSTLLVVFTGYLWTYSWIGITVWAYSPNVVGS